MDSPAYSVYPYQENTLIAFIREKTQSGKRKEVSRKKQLKYLFGYLGEANLNAKTMVIEHEYIDKHYLEDYSEYYVRCFENHSRLCSRVHLFKHEFKKSVFEKALEDGEQENLQFQENYLGYIVIRPIPNTFLGKTCLSPYPYLNLDENRCIIAQMNEVSLFGMQLTVKSVPLLEQDKVVAACASSAVWSLLSASDFIHRNYMPSLSSITKAADATIESGTRIFPSKGLKPVQTAKSLKYFGLEASIIPLDSNEQTGINGGGTNVEANTEGVFDKSLEEMKENIYAYINGDIPLLLGGEIYSLETDNRCEKLGKHMVCVLGYELGPLAKPTDSENLLLRAHDIQKLYVHDDQNGPYARIELEPTKASMGEHPIWGLVIEQ
ncbi:hypothetical protein KKF84_02385, partial [Myxococcota bacterium]|nr:hypothetical protein [Myxococcota bacterium]